MREPKILIACEESQTLCQEFWVLGADVYSCDILEPSGYLPERHLQCDVRDVIMDDWDAIYAFPPCTDLASSGACWFPEKIADGRQQASIEFFKLFTDLPHVPFTLIENPVGIMSTKYRKPDQIIHPWQFGHPTTKRTCLWLKGLPLIEYTEIVPPTEQYIYKSGKKAGRSDPSWHVETLKLPSDERRKARSKTFPGIAKAITRQHYPIIKDAINKNR